jgi:hypothetical protein
MENAPQPSWRRNVCKGTKFPDGDAVSHRMRRHPFGTVPRAEILTLKKQKQKSAVASSAPYSGAARLNVQVARRMVPDTKASSRIDRPSGRAERAGACARGPEIHGPRVGRGLLLLA